MSNPPKQNDSVFLSGPKRQIGVVHCCVCDADTKRPHQATVKGGLEGLEEYTTKHWCLTCGLILSSRDIDKYFPQEQWTDNR
jgi:hypothetical protein